MYGLIWLFSITKDVFSHYGKHQNVPHEKAKFMMGSKKFEGPKTTIRFVPRESYLGQQQIPILHVQTAQKNTSHMVRHCQYAHAIYVH